MKVQIFRLLVLFSIIVSIEILNATPEAMVCMRDIFIGYNDTHYFAYLLIRDYPSSYYHYTDYLFLCKYSLENSTLVESIPLRQILYRDTTTFGDWQQIEMIKEPINTEKYLMENKIFLAYPSSDLKDYKITIDEKGMFLEQDNQKALLMNYRDLQKYLEWIDERTQVMLYYKSDTHYFFVFNNYEGMCYNRILVLNVSDVENAKKLLSEKRK